MHANTPLYKAFSLVYDKTMEEVPYERWAYYIVQKLEEFQVKPSSWILDIGAGTGIIAKKVSSFYKTVALDVSKEMLEHAGLQKNLNCVQANMISLPVKTGKINAAYSTHDCVNYLTNDEEIIRHLMEVKRVLKPKGIYIIDFSTEYNVLNNFHNKTFNEKHDNISMKWTNVYDPVNKIITSTIDIKIKPVNAWKFLYFFRIKKYREIHRQRIFSEEKMIELAKKSGFKVIGKTYDYKETQWGNHAHLVVFILQKT